MVPGRFKDYHLDPQAQRLSLAAHLGHPRFQDRGSKSRSATGRCTPRPSAGSPRTGPTRKASPADDVQVPWIDDLVEILDHADSPEELLEHTRMAMYQDRIFAFTPQGRADPAAQGRDPGRLRLCGPHRPRRPDGRRQGQRPRRSAAHHARQWRPGRNPRVRGAAPAAVAGCASSSPARRAPAIRRFVRHKERDETIELGRKIYDEIVARLPAPLGAEALKRAVKTLKLEDDDALMIDDRAQARSPTTS